MKEEWVVDENGRRYDYGSLKAQWTRGDMGRVEERIKVKNTHAQPPLHTVDETMSERRHYGIEREAHRKHAQTMLPLWLHNTEKRRNKEWARRP